MLFFSPVVATIKRCTATKPIKPKHLPETNYNVFHYLMGLGAELIDEKKWKNQVTADELALAWGRVLLRPPNEARYKKASVVEQQEVLRKRFVFRFLVQASSTSKEK